MIHSAQSRDANEREIIDALQAAGVAVIQMPVGAGFDLLCAYRGIVRIVEVKVTGKIAYTSDEGNVRHALMEAEVPYCVVQSAHDALILWGLG